MNKIFGILAHKVTEALKFTVEYFSSFSENTVFLHVDKKSDITNFEFLKSRNVILLDTRYDVKWGGIAMVQATLELMEKVKDEERFILLSADDFPIYSNEKINKILSFNKDKDFIHFQDTRNSYVDPYERFRYNYPSFFFKKDKKLLEKIKYRILRLGFLKLNREGLLFLEKEKIKLIKGSQWFILRSDSVHKILFFLKEHPDFLCIFKNSFCSDEMFFHTIFNHLNLKRFTDPSIQNDGLRYLDWKSGPDYPRSLDISDFDLIKKSSCLFARKASSELKNMDFSNLISDKNNGKG